MSTLYILSADVRQYWNKYVRFHRGRLGLWVIVGYALLVFGFWNESGPTLTGLPTSSRFSLYVLLTVIVTLADGWNRAYQYLFVRQEARLLRQLRVPATSLVMSFTMLTVVEGLTSSLAYTVTFSISIRYSALLFLLLLLARMITIICMTWFVVFVVTYVLQYRSVFVSIGMLLKALSMLVTIAFALTILLRHDRFFVAITTALDKPWIVICVFGLVLVAGLIALVGVRTRLFSVRFTALRETDARGVFKRVQRTRWIPTNQTLALFMKDAYAQIGTGYILRLVAFSAILFILHASLSSRSVIPFARVHNISMMLLAPTQVAWFNLWLTMMLFLDPCSTLFQDEAAVRRLYWLFKIPIRKVLLAKWVLATSMGLLPLLIGFSVNRAWVSSVITTAGAVLSLIIQLQVITCVVLVSSVALVSDRGIQVNHLQLQQVPQVPSAMISLYVGIIDTVAVSILDRSVHVSGSIVMNLMILIGLSTLLFFFWPKWLRSWYRTHST